MEVSLRGRRAQASPIRKLIPLALEAESRGVKVIRVNIGQPDIETPGYAMEAVRSFGESVLAYSPSDGFGALREKVAGYLGAWGVEAGASDVCVTTGGSEAVLFAMAAVCDPGEKIVVPEPFYANYQVFAAMLGVELTPLTTRFKNNFHVENARDLESRIGPGTKAILLCNPGNPTGTVYTPGEIEMFCRTARERDLFVISDEVYREFLYDGARFTSPLALKDPAKRVIVTDSISKRFSSCGARVGFLVSRNRAVMEVVNKFAMARLSPPTIGQKLAERAFGMDSSYFDGVVGEYEKRRNALVAELSKGEGISFAKPEGAFYIMVRLAGVDSEEFARFLLRDFRLDGETALVAPGPGFYATEGLGADEIRIAYILEAGKMERAGRIVREGYAAFLAKSRAGAIDSG
jgi:aspartate aminotransferase